MSFVDESKWFYITVKSNKAYIESDDLSNGWVKCQNYYFLASVRLRPVVDTKWANQCQGQH